MFKKNFDHLTKETYFGNYREAAHGNPNYFLTYGNGKSAARIKDHLRPNGAHRWHNYMKIPVYVDSSELYIDYISLYYISYALFNALHSCLTLSLLYDFLPFKSDLSDSLQLLII